MRTTLNLILDALTLAIPARLTGSMPYRFAFLVHPRDDRDLHRKLPLLRFLPSRLQRMFQYYWFPATVSRITGLKSAQDRPIDGYVIAIPMSASMMMKHRTRALRQIRSAVRLARNKGARIVGLGALTSSLTHGGLDLIDIPGVAITTGHAYTGLSVSETLLSLMRKGEINPHNTHVAIVGAAGSIGTTTAQLLVRAGVRHLDLIDLPRKKDRVHNLIHRLHEFSKHGTFRYSDTLHPLKHTPFIVTATNAPEALVKPEHVAAGTIIVDDAQPTDVDPLLLLDGDVLVAAAGAVRTPGIAVNFPMGLQGKEDNYCCLAEVLTLAHQERNEHFVLDKPTMLMVDEVSAVGAKLGFHTAPYQNDRGFISEDHLLRVLALVRERTQKSHI